MRVLTLYELPDNRGFVIEETTTDASELTINPRKTHVYKTAGDRYGLSTAETALNHIINFLDPNSPKEQTQTT